MGGGQWRAQGESLGEVLIEEASGDGGQELPGELGSSVLAKSPKHGLSLH
jgi:hypothetical protein